MMNSVMSLLLFAATVSAQAANRQATEETTVVNGPYSANSGIGQWINPNAFTGIFFSLMFFWVCFCVLQATAAIQTPKILLEKTLDWGKVEKTED